MDAARRARMALIGDWAQGRGLGHVALGHTRDDQAETLLMGLARSAGLPGLSGMRRQWEQGGVRYYRPLLDAGREELRDWLQARGISWVDDPTNEDARFGRIKARKALGALEPLGITVAGLARVAGQLAEAQEALTAQAQAVARASLSPAAGALQVGGGLWRAPAAVRRLVMLSALNWLTLAAHAPRAAEVERLMAAMGAGRDATLAGCRFRHGWLMREARAVGGPAGVGALWDGRWRVAGPRGEVRALGAEGLRQCTGWRDTGLPRDVLAVTPGIWRGETLLAAPLAGWANGWTAALVAPDHLFGLSD
jgi:tRNA(Ile)-lysidine synthase